jgi:hypothetical protein
MPPQQPLPSSAGHQQRQLRPDWTTAARQAWSAALQQPRADGVTPDLTTRRHGLHATTAAGVKSLANQPRAEPLATTGQIPLSVDTPATATIPVAIDAPIRRPSTTWDRIGRQPVEMRAAKASPARRRPHLRLDQR